MKNFKNFLKPSWGLTFIAVLFFTACEMDQTQILDQNDSQHSRLDNNQLPEGYESRINPQLRSSDPNGRLMEIEQQTDTYYRELVQRAMAVEPTECSSTEFDAWINEELADWAFNEIFWASITGMLDFPTYDALLFSNTSEGEYFGKDGEYTQKMTKTFKDLKRFWTIDSEDIVLAAMHGNMLQDRDRLIRIDQILYLDDLPTAEYWADLILELLEEIPQYRNGEHPIFTLNAFAQSAFFFPPVGEVPSKIIMGDGILEGYETLGFGDVAPQAILAHEFGHHIQFQLDLFEEFRSPEATRRTELMADAYSAYYLSHSKGATMQWKRVQQFLEVFFAIGDCGFESYGHHGTPIQRMAAAEWGYELADQAQKQGHIMDPLEFATLFDAALPELVAP
ncbi:hypothetical protein [Algoriphagus zhangzhouensis]|uniref:Uncharacterized protein n=1 Tax=Algoriphagus zhangzhouensis TaxID=1073327 RepID=A0A1M7ZJ25_9BACT|nr:hypothetical protein [Algoriphagus zhangzhouensis]TDY43644.1 hypothetical protein A8938_3743 [Algoriphagus zhangzhouensis]SHO64883.1 hypothetical protein SAMN04488108_3718 [Algoriphagus zhangzhouensis]